MSDNLLLRLPSVIALTELSRSTIYSAIQEGRFPRPVRVGRRAVRWRAQDIRLWLERLTPDAAPTPKRQ